MFAAPMVCQIAQPICSVTALITATLSRNGVVLGHPVTGQNHIQGTTIVAVVAVELGGASAIGEAMG